jgi:hypothetical protein
MPTMKRLYQLAEQWKNERINTESHSWHFFNEASPQQAAGYHKEGHCL